MERRKEENKGHGKVKWKSRKHINDAHWIYILTDMHISPKKNKKRQRNNSNC